MSTHDYDHTNKFTMMINHSQVRDNANMLSKDGRCKVFDESADGYVRGEGAAVVVVKPWVDAEKDYIERGAKILGIIKSTAINHNGTSASFTAPNRSSQGSLFHKAIQKAHITPEDILYIEAHGTGTKLGDPIELDAIADIFLHSRLPESPPLVVGACKTNIGHLEAAAGLAGLIKTLMVLQYMKVPPNLHLSSVNPMIRPLLEKGQVIFPSEVHSLRPYQTTSTVYASVSSFGSGGANAHVILQKFEDEEENSRRLQPPTYTSITEKSICFMFTGQASIYPDMGKDLYESSETFRSTVTRCSKTLSLEPSLLSYMFPSDTFTTSSEQFDKMKEVYTHCSIVVLELALLSLLRERNLHPTAVCGHSLGEYAACVSAGILTEEDCLSLVFQRALIILNSKCKGVMIAVRATYGEVRCVIDESYQNSSVSIAAVNGPMSIVLSGEEESVKDAVRKLNKPFRELNIAYPFHSLLMKDCASEFRKISAATKWIESNHTVSFYSCMDGKVLDVLSTHPNEYWSNHLQQPVLFHKCIESIIEQTNIRTFLEVGPQATLKKLGPACSGRNPNIRWIACLDKESNTLQHFDQAIRKCTDAHDAIYMPWRVQKETRGNNTISPLPIEVNKTVVTNLIKKFIPSLDAIEDDISFFHMGLDSLGATELHHRLSHLLRPRNIPASIVYIYPTINKLTSYLLESNSTVESKSTHSTEKSRTLLPATSLQNGMIVECAKYEFAYVERFEWIIGTSSFDLKRFVRSFETLIKRHDSLRSSFNAESIPQVEQIVWDFDSEIFGYQNWFEESSCPHDANALVRFDISVPPLFSLKMCNEPVKKLHLFIHHLIIDGMSMNILTNEISQIYRFGCVREIDESTSFSVVAFNEKEYLSSTSYREGNIFWSRSLNPINKRLAVLPLVCDVHIKDAYRIYESISTELMARLLKRARGLSVTLNSILHAAWSLAYHSLLTPKSVDRNIEVLYGYTTACRSSTAHRVLGPVVNTIPMAFSCSADLSIIEYIESIHQKLVQNMQFDTYPLALIKNSSPSMETLLFSSVFDYQHVNWNFELSKDSSIDFVRFNDKIGYPLSVRVFQYNDSKYEILLQSESNEFTVTDLTLLKDTIMMIIDNFSTLDIEDTRHFSVKDLLLQTCRSKDNDFDMVSNGLDSVEKHTHVHEEFILSMTKEQEEVYSMIKSTIRSVWATIFSLDQNISDDSNFFALGGNSLLSIQVVARCRQAGLEVRIPDIFNAPNLRDLSILLTKSQQYVGPKVLGTHEVRNSSATPFTVDMEAGNNYETFSFPLIGINLAHFVGLHTSSYSPNGLAPQIYFEWDIVDEKGGHTSLDTTVFENAINVFVQRHLIFRSFCTEDGNMQILAKVPMYKMNVTEYCGSDCTEQLLATRHRMMQSNLSPFEWPLFEFVTTHTSFSSSTVHVRISLFLMDAIGDLILRQEISNLYRAGKQHAHSLEKCQDAMAMAVPTVPVMQFDKYSIAVHERLHDCSEYKESHKFWKERIESLPGGPQIPMNQSIASTGNFVNHNVWISPEEWSRLKSNCMFHGITIPVALLTVYAMAIYRWSGQHHFLINILQCMRLQIHEDANRMVGNCSSTVLCSIDLSHDKDHSAPSFIQVAKRIGTELAQNLEYSIVSGIDVMQELNRLNGRTFNVVAPFIFTCPIGVESSNPEVKDRDWIFKETFFSEKVPHTACVNAIKEYKNGSACASLDIMEGIFPEEVLIGLSKSYGKLLKILGSTDVLRYKCTINDILGYPDCVQPYSMDLVEHKYLLHDGLLLYEPIVSNKAAVIGVNADGSIENTIIYGSLKKSVYSLAHEIQKQSVMFSKSKERVIAIIMYKGWEQILSVLSVLLCGYVYLPMDVQSWSESRIKNVIELSGAVMVCSTAVVLEKHAWVHQLQIPVVDVNKHATSGGYDDTNPQFTQNRALDTDIAYLIYTSGSTGIPKGVSCHHKGAVNTIFDLNDHFSVNSNDRIFSISSLSFDLSVYDIFGSLFVGASIVIPPAEVVSPPDPDAWVNAIETCGVTIWNSVPAFMDLLISQLEMDNKRLPISVRLILLSGDWLPTSLAPRIRNICLNKNVRIISLGGATEASIWSNIYEIGHEGEGVPATWTSVPVSQSTFT